MDNFGKYTTGCGIQNKWYKIQGKTARRSECRARIALREALWAGQMTDSPERNRLKTLHP
jgi:hypothetical protein